jgi:hypothetical protein
MLSRFISPKFRVWFGWLLLIGSTIGWPLSLWFTDEPPFILSLSWLAVWIEGWNAVQIADEAKD